MENDKASVHTEDGATLRKKREEDFRAYYYAYRFMAWGVLVFLILRYIKEGEIEASLMSMYWVGQVGMQYYEYHKTKKKRHLIGAIACLVLAMIGIAIFLQI